jgi:hypothetical protein
LPEIAGEQRREQMLVDSPQPCHSRASAKLVQNAHAGHLSLTPQSGELSPGTLLG